MSEVTDEIKKLDFFCGFVSKDEAIRFVNRFVQVLLKQAIETKTEKKCQ